MPLRRGESVCVMLVASGGSRDRSVCSSVAQQPPCAAAQALRGRPAAGGAAGVRQLQPAHHRPPAHVRARRRRPARGVGKHPGHVGPEAGILPKSEELMRAIPFLPLCAACGRQPTQQPLKPKTHEAVTMENRFVSK
jgi:hypothetical protein